MRHLCSTHSGSLHSFKNVAAELGPVLALFLSRTSIEHLSSFYGMRFKILYLLFDYFIFERVLRLL